MSKQVPASTPSSHNSANVTESVSKQERDQKVDSFIEFFTSYQNLTLNGLIKQDLVVEIDYTQLERFNPQLASEYCSSPQRTQEYAERAIYEVYQNVASQPNIPWEGCPTKELVHGFCFSEKTDYQRQTSLTIPLQVHARIYNLPETNSVTKVTPQDRSKITSITGRIYLNSNKTRRVAVNIQCDSCSSRSQHSITPSSTSDRMTCPACTKTNNQSSSIHIEWSNIRSATIIPVTDSDPYDSDSFVTIHLEDDLVSKFSDGDLVTAVVDYRQAILKGHRGEEKKTHRLVTHSLKSPTETDLQKTDWYPSGRAARMHTPKTLDRLIMELDVCLSGCEHTEGEVRHKIITPILELVGWNKYDNTRFSLERSSENSQRRTDYILSNSNGSPVLLIETKSSKKSLRRSTQQLTEYLNEYEAPYGLLTNGHEYRLFKRTTQNGEITITEQDSTKFPNPDPDFFKQLAPEE